MAQISRQVGTTSQVTLLFVQDSSSTTGAGLTGLAHNTGSLTAYYKRSNGTASVAITLANITTLGTFVSGGFKEVDATNMPGVYEFHPPNAALASGADSVAILLKGAANMAPCPLIIELTGTSNQDATAGGISRLDAAISTRSTYAGGDTSGTTTLLGRIGGAITIAGGKVAATLASADVTGNIACDLQTIKTQAVTAAAGVTFPASIGTSTYSGADTSGTTTLLSRVTAAVALAGSAPSWYATTGLKLASDGLDSVVIDASINARQALSLIASATAGTVSGNDTNSPVFKGINTNTTRITATTTAAGNRTAVTLSPPA